MKKEKILPFVLAVGLLQIFLIPFLAEGFDDRAHISLTRRATQLSTLDNFLKATLPFEFFDGLNEPIFNGSSVAKLVEDGAFDEDRPILWRPRHHFHNPRLAWGEAGGSRRRFPFSLAIHRSSGVRMKIKPSAESILGKMPGTVTFRP